MQRRLNKTTKRATKQNAQSASRKNAPHTYRGKRTSSEYSVFVSLGGREQIFRRGIKFAWGGTGAAAAMLAHELVSDVTDDAALTQRVYRRFLHRVVAQWKPDQPWIMAEAEVRDVIADIVRVEQETAPLRRMVETAPPAVAFEGDVGAVGVPVGVRPGTPDRFR
jgi:hypothetical protein